MTQTDKTNAIALLQPLLKLDEYQNVEEVLFQIHESLNAYLKPYKDEEILEIRKALEEWGVNLYQDFLNRIIKNYQEKHYDTVIKLSENLYRLATRHVFMRTCLMIYPPFSPRYYLNDFDRYLCEMLYPDVTNEILPYDYMTLYLYRVKAYQGMQQIDKALETLQRAIELDPTNTKLYFLKANILKDKDLEAAHQALNEAYLYIHTQEDYFAFLSKKAIYFKMSGDDQAYFLLKDLIEKANGSYQKLLSLPYQILKEKRIPLSLSNEVLQVIQKNYQLAKEKHEAESEEYFSSLLSDFYSNEERKHILSD